MTKKYIVTILLSCLFSAVFIGSSETEMEKAAEIFNTSWLDALKVVVVGIVTGLILRMQNIRSAIEAWPMAPLVYSSNFLYLGIFSILVGAFGAGIIYYDFGETNLARVPLHSSVIGLGMVSMFYVIHWRTDEGI